VLLVVKGVHVIHRACKENDKESGNGCHNGPSNIRSSGFDDGNTCSISISFSILISINPYEHLWSWLWEINTHCLAQSDLIDLVELGNSDPNHKINSYFGCNATQVKISFADLMIDSTEILREVI